MSSVPQIFAGLCLLLILTSCVGVEPHRDFDRPTASASSASSSTRSGSIFTNTSRRGTASLKAGLGFTLDPDTFLMGIEGSYHVHPNFSVGPLLQAGVSGKQTLIAPTLNVHGIMDLPPHALSRLKPYLQGGIGMAYLEENNRPGDNDDEGFLFNLGGGADYYISDRFAIGTDLLFNILPDKTLDENFFFSWQVATASFHF